VGGADEEELEGGTGGEHLGGDNIRMSLGQHRTEKNREARDLSVWFFVLDLLLGWNEYVTFTL
jgi:hypothetical protein